MMRVLLVRLGALGDLVHALPFAAALRAAHPDARIDWLVDVRYRALLDLVPTSIVTERLVLDTRAMSGPTSAVAVIRRLRLASYDIAFDAQGLIKSALLAHLSGAARVVGFAKSALREPAAGMFYTESIDPAAAGVVAAARGGEPAGDLPGGAIGSRGGSESAGDASGGVVHVVAKTLSLLRAIGIEPSGPAAWQFPLEIAPSPVPACTRELLGIDGEAPFALINPGAAWPNKRWPPERFAALAREVQARCGLKSAVLWGPGEETMAAQIARASAGAADMAPATTLMDAIALAREARVVVSGDTGPTHLAAAVGTPIVGIYGPTDPARNGPWHPGDVCVSRFGVCACHHQRQCRQPERWCLAGIAVDEVLQAVQQRLASQPARRDV